MDLGAPELLIILVVALLLFGGEKLPQLARSLGAAQREFRRGQNSADTSDSRSSDEAGDEGSPGLN